MSAHTPETREQEEGRLNTALAEKIIGRSNIELLDALVAERDALKAREVEMGRLLEKALVRSAVVHPGFADEIRSILSKVTL